MNIQFALDFLKDLAQNNDKAWMDQHKKRYLEAKQQVIELVSETLAEITTFDPSIGELDPKKTLFRINRDIRFSKNKAPYKTNFGAFLARGGKKSINPGYYLHVQPGNNFLGGGIYQPQSDVLAKVRQEIDYNGEQLRSIINSRAFKDVYKTPIWDDRLKTAPRGYPKNHENLDLLQLKHYVCIRNVQDEEITSKCFIANISTYYKTLYPFNQFLAQALD